MFLSILFDKIWYFVVCFNQISDIKTQLWSFLWVDLPPGGRELYWALVSAGVVGQEENTTNWREPHQQQPWRNFGQFLYSVSSAFSADVFPVKLLNAP